MGPRHVVTMAKANSGIAGEGEGQGWAEKEFSEEQETSLENIC